MLPSSGEEWNERAAPGVGASSLNGGRSRAAVWQSIFARVSSPSVAWAGREEDEKRETSIGKSSRGKVSGKTGARAAARAGKMGRWVGWSIGYAIERAHAHAYARPEESD